MAREGAIRLLQAVTAIGAGAAVILDPPRRSFGLQVTHTGGPTVVVVSLDGSIDGTNWFSLGSWSTLTFGDIVFIVDKVVTQIRGNLTVLTGGTSPTVTAWVAAA
jgi:hypothetical protein